MEGQQQEQEQLVKEQLVKSRVVKVDSKESWDLFLNQAQSQGCPTLRKIWDHFVFRIVSIELLYVIFSQLATSGDKTVIPRQAKHLIVIHFTADWCMPSVAMNQFFEELALSYQDILFLVVDVDELKEVASKMEVKAMPTFVLMWGGAQVDKIVGANPDEIKKRMDTFVSTIRLQKSID